MGPGLEVGNLKLQCSDMKMVVRENQVQELCNSWLVLLHTPMRVLAFEQVGAGACSHVTCVVLEQVSVVSCIDARSELQAMWRASG